MTSPAAGRLSSTGRRPSRPLSRAFTLLEVVIAVALVGLMAGLFITAGTEMMRARERTATDIFWQAVQGARQQAVQEDATVLMHFDEKTNRVIWNSATSSHDLAWPGKKLEFLPTERNDSVLLGGQLVGTGAMPVVRFYADGCSDRFRAQLTDTTGRVTRLDLDPWTCAPVLRSAP
ncbi:MAG TPA: prepilin-type N-terminal cleavage/methylation domain-containing protein [Lacunisphaera sp.]|nr:prepilin-type N-terminal cleavage/methylation domain-containing protein [Lacunisphaera sp.]